MMKLYLVCCICISSSVFANIELHLSSLTPYRLVANHNVDEFKIAGCRPKKIWMLVRHGTRYPKSQIIQAMNERLPELRETILSKSEAREANKCELCHLRDWTPISASVTPKMLTAEGEKELLELGERMQLRFPSLFPAIYTPSTFRFNSTVTDRTKASMRFFATGVFGRGVTREIAKLEECASNKVLRFYETCPCWLRKVKENPARHKQAELFSKSSEMQKTLKAMSAKLGFHISFDDALLMYRTCAFETAWNIGRKKSPWCFPFDKDTIQTMEYVEDLKHYYKDGYGYDITYKQACVAIHDLLQFFDSKNITEKAAVYFSHSGTLLKVLTYIGLYKDSKRLLHNNHDPNRKWRTSKIDSFASNLAFVLYDCAFEEKVMMFHQEQPIPLPGCDLLCSLAKLKKLYASSVAKCDLEHICKLSECKVNDE